MFLCLCSVYHDMVGAEELLHKKVVWPSAAEGHHCLEDW